MSNNQTCQAQEIPYSSDTATLFRHLCDQPWSIWLDSAGCARFDILVVEPRTTFVTHGTVTTICDHDGCRQSDADPLQLLRRELSDGMVGPSGSLPFSGGAVGYFAYDLARRYERLPQSATEQLPVPDMAVGIYDWGIVVDHVECKSWITGRTPEALAVGAERYRTMQGRNPGPLQDFIVEGAPNSNLSSAQYQAAVGRIHDYLRAGDCYQVNFSQRFCTSGSGSPLSLYLRLREVNPAPYSAYLNLPFVQVLSASPERFLRVKERQVETRPIKGTRRRLTDPLADAQVRVELGASAKDRAENLMIVDLLRNDLGKSCEVGTVSVPQLFEVETFATVHHLVSTVRGRLAEGKDSIDLLRDCFPGGSITGAPKLRAMEIIEELEPERRGIYCGSIGYIGFDGAMDTNIVIRTLVLQDGNICFAAGGGVVMDSTAAAEYQESLDKAAALLAVLHEFTRPE